LAVDEAVGVDTSPTQEELRALLVGRFTYADGYRSQFDERAIDSYKLYIGYREQITDPKLQGRSNLHIPRPYEELDALRARLVKSFFGSRPYMDFLPVPQPTQAMSPELQSQNEQKAQVAASLVDQQLERNGIVGKWYEFVTNFLIFPAAMMAVGWRYERRPVKRRVPQPVYSFDSYGNMVPAVDPMTGQPQTQLVMQQTEEVVWDDNEISVLDWGDFWVDPRGKDVDSARFIFHREWLTREQIEEKLQLLAESENGEVFPVDWEALEGEGAHLEEGKWERLSAVGVAADPGGDHWATGEKPGKPFEVLHYWTDDNYGLLINRHTLAFWGANPFWRHGKKPYILCSYDPLPGEPYGLSAMQVIEHLAHELNTLRNQRIDATSLVLNPIILKRRGSDINDDVVFAPGAVWEVDDPNEVAPFLMPDVKASSYTEESVVKQDMENALGVAAVVRGVDPGNRQTATEIATKQTNAGVRFEVKIALYQACAVNRLAALMDMNNQQYIDAPRYVQIYGAEAMAQWQMVQPGDLIGERDYRPAGANLDPAANREIRRQQLLQLVEMAWKLNVPYFERYELIRQLVDTYELRNPAKVLIPYQELMRQQMMMMQQQQQMAAQQAMMGAQGPPMQQAPPMGAVA
jgi:hypothetical protein